MNEGCLNLLNRSNRGHLVEKELRWSNVDRERGKAKLGEVNSVLVRIAISKVCLPDSLKRLMFVFNSDHMIPRAKLISMCF